ncbi:MAG: 4-phosphopantetheinyl transferase superfamily protein [Sphingomonadales bacterium]|nr:4-phosphopantetheinyl transferase superfamily protein [Sphingomonadales bacterium]
MSTLSGTIEDLRVLRCHRPVNHPAIIEFAPVARDVAIFLTPREAGGDEKPSRALLGHALRIRYGSAAEASLAISGHGQPLIERGDMPCTFSSAAVGDQLVVAITGCGRIGIDMETVDRVALNATPADRWLADGERVVVNSLGGDGLVTELACCWVLKEAYGKARGVGLNYALAEVAFRERDGRVRAIASHSPEAERVEAFDFALFRYGSLLFGLAQTHL